MWSVPRTDRPEGFPFLPEGSGRPFLADLTYIYQIKTEAYNLKPIREVNMMITALTTLNKRLITLEQQLDEATDEKEIKSILNELADIECDLNDLGGIDD